MRLTEPPRGSDQTRSGLDIKRNSICCSGFRLKAPQLEGAHHDEMKEKECVMLEKIDEATRTELEAAAFRRLVEHLRERTDVQNIDLMNLSGFCRNCLSRWYQEAAEARGLEMDKETARKIIYGMPYAEWREKYQREATPEQLAAFAKANPQHD